MTSPNVDPSVASQVRIFDTTLRDGEQAPHCSMTLREKVAVARQLVRLGVDVIEAGFPAASPGDWASVKAVAEEVGSSAGPIVCGLARASRHDIEQCASAVRPARRHRIHTFIATSDLHLQHKLHLSRAQVVERAREMVTLARSLSDDVEFTAEDATRSDPDFLLEVFDAAVEAGATTLNAPDTVGYATPEEYARLIGALASRYEAHGVVVSTHCHDDLGLAVANSLAGIRAGARQVECTINGLGERAGNAALEEIVMTIATRNDRYPVRTTVASEELVPTSRLVARCTGVSVPPNKAIVGANAFAHEAGIHQDGVLKHRATYEIMTAESVGFDGNALVLGKHSGRHALRHHLNRLGHELESEAFERAFTHFKRLADDKTRIDDAVLTAIVGAL
jgi:2-isopropylmalate synthase